MAKFGRFVCVLVPFLLTLGSLIAMLVAGLACVADKSLYMFEVDMTSLSISPLLATKIPNDAPVPVVGSRQVGPRTTNLTAADLGLYNVYDVGIWAYCYTAQDGTHSCIKPAFDWVEHTLNLTTARNDLDSLLTSTGLNITLPKDISGAAKALGTVTKGTQAVFIVAYIILGVELVLGLFANFSRFFSCLTWLVALISVIAVGAAAGLATAISAVVVGAVKATAILYGAEAHFNTRFLATIWIGVAFAIAASLFWLFTICCCGPGHSSRRRPSRRPTADEKLQVPAAPASPP